MKKLVILGLMFLLLIGVVKANFNNSLYAVYHFDQNYSDSYSTNHLTYSATTINTTAILGNGSVNYDQTSDYLYRTNYGNDFNETRPWTVSIWVNISSMPADRYLFTFGDIVANSKAVRFKPSGSKIYMSMRSQDGGGITEYNAQQGQLLNNNTWYHIVSVYNSTSINVYIDGSLDSEFATLRTLNAQPDFTLQWIAHSLAYDGHLDDTIIWTRILNDTEISTLYNSGNPITYPQWQYAPAVYNINITLVQPEDNIYNYSQLNNYCFNAVTDLDIIDCSLYTNSSGTMNLEKANNTPVLNSTDYCIDWNSTADGHFNWKIVCNNSNDDSFESNTRKLKIDSNSPLLFIYQPINETTYDNETDIQVDLRCTDETVYILNYTFFNASGIIQSGQNMTTTSNLLTLNETIETENLAMGYYLLNMSCSDGHTDKAWDPDTSILQITGGINFVFDSKDNVKVEIKNAEDDKKSKVNLDQITTIKEKDRYKFNLNFEKTIKNFEYVITADKIVEYNSQYKGHLVLYDKYWFDTEPYAVESISIDGNKAVIKVRDVNKASFETKSIGGLNIVEEQYQLRICTPNWYCSSSYCNPVSDSIVCTAAQDYNSCGQSYLGDYSEFSGDYCGGRYEVEDLDDISFDILGKAGVVMISVISLILIAVGMGYAAKKIRFKKR